MSKLAGKRVWLTGASTGIGRAVALELAAQGAVTGLTSRNEPALRALRDEIEGMGGRAIVLPGDVTDAVRMKEIAREFEGQAGPIDILIANAGSHLFTRPERFDAREYLGLMDLNYGGMLRCIEAVLPNMLERRAGHIVGVASLAGFRGVPRAAAYGASKAAMISFLESLRFHVTRSNVRVTIVNPGFVRTPLTDKNDFRMPFLMDADQAARTICSGIARGKDEVVFPFPFSWMIKAMRIIPFPLYKLIMSRAVWIP